MKMRLKFVITILLRRLRASKNWSLLSFKLFSRFNKKYVLNDSTVNVFENITTNVYIYKFD